LRQIRFGGEFADERHILTQSALGRGRAGAGTSELRLTQGQRLQHRTRTVGRLDGDIKHLVT